VTRPVIGLTAATENVRYGPWEEVAHMVPRAYTDAVKRADGLALLLPSDDAVAEAPDQVLDMLDGLLLTGGCDIDPMAYGARPDPATGTTDPERDRFEIALGSRALERDLPLLGVCRGMQMLNVAAGGTLEQHVPDRIGRDAHRELPGSFTRHEVNLEPGTLADRAVGSERCEVCSHHHQGADELGEGVVATGWSADDGLVEAIELPERRFALGVLWHPEEDRESRVIGAFVEATRSEAAVRGTAGAR